MWSRSIEVFDPYVAIKSSIKKAKIRHEKAYTDRGYLYIKSYNPYVHGVCGTDIKLTFKQKIQILFCEGISVCILDNITNGRTDKELDAILADLEKKRQHKKDIQIAKAQAEISAIHRESEAYFDGLYDAIKAVKAIMPEPPKGE